MEAVLDAVQDQGPPEPDLVRHVGLEISRNTLTSTSKPLYGIKISIFSIQF